MTTSTHTLAQSLLNAFMAKDKARVLAAFTDDGVLIDPHYPQPVMQGKDAIGAGLDFGFGFIQQPGFAVRKTWADETSCVVEVDTHHTFINGTEAQFPQIFVFEFAGGLISRLQSYVPYPPPAPPA